LLTSFKSISGYIDIEINDKYLERISLAKNVIYTCNAGSYSPVKHISSLIDLSRKKGHDFFIFTDKKIKNINEYNQILFNFKSPNPRYAAKIFKIRPDLFFTNAEVSLWIDANVQFNKNFFQKIKEFKSSNAEIFLFNHDKRSNIFEEANECKKYLKDDIYIIDNQIENYKKKDKNLENIGLYQGRILLRKHNDNIKNFSIFWLSEILENSIRDQLSLPFALKKSELILDNAESRSLSKYFNVLLHNKYNTYTRIDSFEKLMLSLKYKLTFLLIKLREILR
tara:strand:+ start:22133 stop:22975 length:843 start_codon:yes stop_codon:yes gene_type:complete